MGGPPVRGTKLLAWRIPAIWKNLQENVTGIPEKSSVLQKQKRLFSATREVLAEVETEVREGLLETVGINSSSAMTNGRSSMILELPEDTDTEKIAQAIDMENVEAWCDENGKVNIAISPWYSTKDVDQTVLSAVKVIHVMLGLHADDSMRTKTLKEKILGGISEIMQIQKNVKK